MTPTLVRRSRRPCPVARTVRSFLHLHDLPRSVMALIVLLNRLPAISEPRAVLVAGHRRINRDHRFRFRSDDEPFFASISTHQFADILDLFSASSQVS